jgi:hypothetical protein
MPKAHQISAGRQASVHVYNTYDLSSYQPCVGLTQTFKMHNYLELAAWTFSVTLSRLSSWITAYVWWIYDNDKYAKRLSMAQARTASASGLTPLSIRPTHVARVSLSSFVLSSWEMSNKTGWSRFNCQLARRIHDREYNTDYPESAAPS